MALSRRPEKYPARLAWLVSGCCAAGLWIGSGCQHIGHPLQNAASKLATIAGEGASAAAEGKKPGEITPAQAPPLPDFPPGLADDRWVLSVRSATAAQHAPAFNWRHAALGPLLELPADRRPDLSSALGSTDSIVSANAAIAQARWGTSSTVGDRLIAVVRKNELRLPLRSAAAEMAAVVCSPETTAGLIDEMAAASVSGQSGYAPELHAELLTGLARKVRVSREPCFDQALRSPAVCVRLAAVTAWRDCQDPAPLPQPGVDLREDPDPKLRAAALQALARHPAPRAHELIAAGCEDQELGVRLAAVAALGEIGGEQAQKLLEKLLSHESELSRAAAVRALARMHADERVRRAAGDKSWRVRLAVAESLKQLPRSPLDVNLAHDLLHDANVEVQRRAIGSLDSWPLSEAGPLLLAVLADGSFTARKEAAAQLARRWAPAADFPANGSAERRAAALPQIKQRWAAEFGSTSHVELTSAKTTGDAEPSPQADKCLAAMARLRSADHAERRVAAKQLAEAARSEPLSMAALRQLLTIELNEADPTIWQSLLEAIADDARPEAAELACLAIHSPSADCRRRACEHLARHPSRRQVAQLLPLLGDADKSVLSAAADALGRQGDQQAVAPLTAMLTADDKPLRVRVAAALARLHADAGAAALDRLALDDDRSIRLLALQAMGEMGDAAFVPTLIAGLEDRPEIQRAALEALEQVANPQLSLPPESSPAEKAKLWRAWYEARGAAVETRLR